MDNQNDLLKPKIIEVDIQKEMKKSFLDYSMSVIVSRALPDVRDGLKPVHRRILYSQFEDNLTPDRPYKKCATTVGNVLGRYHPHGDTSVYDALVRLAQDFSMRYTLVDGHGNFGSIDGDPPAAYRYTEARLSKIAVEMLSDIDKDTVDFNPNYDDSRKEPVVLPSRFPNLLVNGSTGIAVGMATNIPPHNLAETIDAVCYLIDNPDAQITDLMNFIKGPDFPTGALIMGISGIRSAYMSGRGKITVRARAQIVEEKNNRFKIIITELPYQVNKARLIESIADLVKDKRVQGISSINDHSDRNGMHIEITLKRDASPNIILNQLYSFTNLQITFGVIMLAIVNGEPKTLNLKQILSYYLDFQVEVIKRRTAFDLKKAQERSHILEGLKIAIDFLDQVISIIRSSKDQTTAKATLSQQFSLDDVQAQAIVQMRLGQLTNLERNKIQNELNDLLLKIKNLQDILADNNKIKLIIKQEITKIKQKYSNKRKTEIQSVSGEVDIEDLIPNEECVLTITEFGFIKRQKVDTYKTQQRGGKGITALTTKEEDITSEMFVIKNHDYIIFFTDKGKSYKLKAYEIPENSRISKGIIINNLIPLEPDEHINSMISVQDFNENKYLVMITKKGVIKRTNLKYYASTRKGSLIAIELDPGDKLVSVIITNGNDQLIVATKKGKAIRFKESDVRALSRTARGVMAIRLDSDDSVIGISKLKLDAKLLTISEDGYGRLSDFNDYHLQSRGGKGVINYKTDKYGLVASIKTVSLDDDIIVISSDGVIIRIEVNTINQHSRASKGVKIMRLSVGSKVITVSRVPKQQEYEK